MSKEAKECSRLSGMLVNQWVTSAVFFHWLTFVFFLISELMLSRICLVTFPSSLFARFLRRHVGWLAKFSLWSFRIIKACCFATRTDLFCAVVDVELLGNGWQPLVEGVTKSPIQASEIEITS